MQQYLQHEHYALWEVIKFRDSYTAPESSPSITTTSTTSGDKSGRTVTLTTEDIQNKKNDTFGGNEATKKTKKNLLKQQYGNFRAKGAETLEQTFTKLQVISGETGLMSLDDLYNHLKVYEAEVQKKSEPNTQNIAFISLTKHSRGNDEVNTASSNVPTASVNVATMLQGLINQKLNASTVTRWVISLENAEHPETKREEAETPTDRGLKLKNRPQKH
nr:hypothetical protein [Tanacetum cinerariifolium]